MAKDYWKDRQARALTNLSNKSAKAIEEQLRKYYAQTMRRTIADFEATFDKLQATAVAGRQPTPADLYKLDKYWEAQAQLKKELQRLGDKEAELLGAQFENSYKDIYRALAKDSGAHYSRISTQGAEQMIKQVWAADGKSWSKRIWDNTEDLAATLNEKLIECVVGGKKTSDLKKALMDRFNVSFSRADALARTELAHIQTQAARQRYEDTGIEYVEIWADEDERRCEVCGKLHQKRYPVGAKMPIPAHPRCRCTIIPVVDIPDEDIIEQQQEQAQKEESQVIDAPETQEIQRPIIQGKNLIGESTPDFTKYNYDIESVVHEQGYDGLPQVMPYEDFKVAMEKSNFYAERTYSAATAEQLAEYKEMLRNGDWYIDCSTGGAQYGQGMYCAACYDLNDNAHLGGIGWEMSHYQEIGIAAGRPHSYTEGITLQPDAKILKIPLHAKAEEYISDVYAQEYMRKYCTPAQRADVEKYISARQKIDALTWNEDKAYIDALYDDRDACFDKVRELSKKAGDAMMYKKEGDKYAKFKNAGTLAAEMGYDAINADGHGQSGSYTVILNRTKVILCEEGSIYGN